jgi:4-alpha-glucanotransferase
MPWAFIHVALESTARLDVVPAQDLLGLGSESRMNTPGTAQGN